MWFDLRKEGLDFVKSAPVVYRSEAPVGASRALVFGAFADAPSWKAWFPNVREASYTSPPPHGVAAARQAHVGGTWWIEDILAWDAGTRLAWTVVRTSIPFAKAQVELFEFADAGDGTRILWTLALEPRLLARLGAPFTQRAIERVLQRAAQNLAAYLRHVSPGESAPATR